MSYPRSARLRRRLACLLLLATPAVGCKGSPAGEYVPDVFEPDVRLPALHVAGNRIVDADGTVVVLQGIALADPDQVNRDGHWDAEYFQQAASWGARIVRIPVHPKNWRRLGPAAYLALVDEGVRWAEAQEMYVILDWHGMGDPVADRYEPTADGLFVTSRAETEAFWRIAAAHFRNDPGVAFFELFNEPTSWMSDGTTTTTTWKQWRPLAEGLVDLIRGRGASAVCLVSGFHWAYDLTAAGTDPVARDGVAYAVHPYPSQGGATGVDSWQQSFGYLAATYPVFATELGFDADPGDPVAYATADGYGTLLDTFLADRGIHWTVWVFHPVWTPSLLADWSYTPTAPQGDFYRSLLLAR